MSDLKPGSCTITQEALEDLPQCMTLLDLLKKKGYPTTGLTNLEPDDRYIFTSSVDRLSDVTNYSWKPKENG